MRESVILHPLLFAISPVLFLFARNMDQFPVNVIALPLAATACSALLLWALLSFLLKDWAKAGLVVSLFFVLFFSYENVYDEMRDIAVGLGATRVGTREALLVSAILILALCTYFVIRTRRNLGNITQILNLMSGFLLFVSLVNISAYAISTGPVWRETEAIENMEMNPPKVDDPTMLPDIYYIILDGYGRADILQELYGYDNGEFLQYLTEAGFYVASDSRANYCQTLLSLAASLNMTYLDDLAERVGVNARGRVPLIDMIMNGRVLRLLRESGYVIVAYSSGWVGTEVRNADVYMAPRWSLDEFQTQLINMTPVPFIGRQLGIYDEYGLHRERILFALDQLGDEPELEAPRFVFAHIVAPHPPFVFGRNGEPIAPDYRFALHDGTHVISRRRLTRDEYVQGYREQLIFINSKIQLTIDDILAKSTRPLVIILQADHGPGSMLDWEDPDNTYLKERFSILNAYYLSDGADVHLYDSITPVNTFRLLFSHYLGADYNVIEDESYFSTWSRPYSFIKVTDEVTAIAGTVHRQ